MAMNINNIEEEGYLTNEGKDSQKVKKWGLLLLSCTFNLVGLTGGPLLLRLYFLHGGNRKWFSSLLQMAGFPILIIPLTLLYRQRDPNLPNIKFFASRKLFLFAALIGLTQGVDRFMYCYGLSFLPVSTSSLLVATQLVFTAIISFIWVKQKFTPYSINAIVVITMGCVLLGVRSAGDRPHGVTNSQYLLGFFISIADASIIGFILVSTQVAYAKANQAMTYPIVLQFQVCLSFFATLCCTIGSLINGDFSAIRREAREFDLGTNAYYIVLVSVTIVWQLMFIGRVGIIFCTSSLFAGVMSATFLPISQMAAVITFHENFAAEKGMALALTLWGFTSYFYGSYKKTKTTKSASL
ncbi:hypothetical protein MKW94_017371 [Papaver nudicaule]|uniref:Probable purine permease n=1 Tax=Papaver nudicaule TaxID=74823 RepID=A0AA41S3F3_PAPNU|nr:hypothetical protein [Papaver nudicaule]MCL7032638.1 hypothetical protein [Papaver nudicaule]